MPTNFLMAMTQSDDHTLRETRYINGDFPEICCHTFYSGALDETSVVVDLGGSIGVFSSALATLKNCTCHIVEAAGANYRAIQLGKKNHKYHHAITGSDGPIDLLIPDGEEFHWGMVTPEDDAPAGTRETVPGITLESFLKNQDIARIDLLKVDIEGAEIDMFDSTPDRILCKIGQITIEFHDFVSPEMGPHIERIKARLKDLGFTCIVFTRNFHGDVLFINRNLVPLSSWRLILLAGPIKYWRGLKRIFDRI
ncbi:MAG TPA: FkbM family methyltransferase [Rhodospirillales bacterium]|nr:FkbM family methyltransferase [Rhodospirillales bacterium]